MNTYMMYLLNDCFLNKISQKKMFSLFFFKKKLLPASFSFCSWHTKKRVRFGRFTLINKFHSVSTST